MGEDQLGQHQPAAPAAPAAESMHGRVGHLESLQNHYVAQPLATGTRDVSRTTLKYSGATAEAVSASQSGNTLPSSNKSSRPAQRLDERSLAHEAALRRLNGLDPPRSSKSKAQDSNSVAGTEPVLVREYSNSPSDPGSSRYAKMKQRRKSQQEQRSSDLPPLENFSFQDILASIEPEIRGSIDTIAEICGRSRMSLADEYGSHLPPQGDLDMPSLQTMSEPIEATSRLEPVEEASSIQEQSSTSRHQRSRSTRLSLANNPAHIKSKLPSSPVTATSAVASQTQSSALSQPLNPQPSYIPQILAWLRNSRVGPRDGVQSSRRDSGAATSLQRLLGSSPDAPIAP
ncbi:MAG: hypothetical protein Q9190_004034 [Brigantiaea leucoxantha]